METPGPGRSDSAPYFDEGNVLHETGARRPCCRHFLFLRPSLWQVAGILPQCMAELFERKYPSLPKGYCCEVSTRG